MNVEPTAERHALLAKELTRAQRRSESLLHYVLAAELYDDDDDRQYKASYKPYQGCIYYGIYSGVPVYTRVHPEDIYPTWYETNPWNPSL